MGEQPVHRTVLVVTVLSRGPWDAGADLDEISLALDEGEVVGEVVVLTQDEVVPAEDLHAALAAVGADPAHRLFATPATTEDPR